MEKTGQPVVITVFKMKADLVRQVAVKYNYLYEERPVLGNDKLIKFFFNPLDDVNTNVLVAALPVEVFAYKVIVGDGSSRG